MSKAITLKRAEERIDGIVWKYHDRGFGAINYLTVKLTDETWAAKLTKTNGQIVESHGDLRAIKEDLEEQGLSIENIKELQEAI